MSGWSRSRFTSFLSRLGSGTPLTREDDLEGLQELAETREPNSREQEIHRNKGPGTFEQFLTHVKSYSQLEDGLADFGYGLINREKGPNIVSGAFASVQVAYKLSDAEKGQPLQRRHLCAAKLQSSQSYKEGWTEIQCLRGIVHPHVIGFFGAFAVVPPKNTAAASSSSGASSPTSTVPEDMVVILMEYANAGDLGKEVTRYPNNKIPESGVKYYVRQICSGVRYMHTKGVVHNDLSVRNVLLKYRRDGTKVCMLCDFGLSRILPSSDPNDLLTSYFRDDVSRLLELICKLFDNKPPATAKDVRDAYNWTRFGSSHMAPQTVDQLLQLKWFKNLPRPEAPIPKSPTPLLKPETVAEIGYAPQDHPSGEPEPEPSSEGETVLTLPVPHSSPKKGFFSRTRKRITSGVQSLACLPIPGISSRFGKKEKTPTPSPAPSSSMYYTPNASMQSLNSNQSGGSYRRLDSPVLSTPSPIYLTPHGSHSDLNQTPGTATAFSSRSTTLQVPVEVHRQASSGSGKRRWHSEERTPPGQDSRNQAPGRRGRASEMGGSMSDVSRSIEHRH